MNRAETRRQQKLAALAAKKAPRREIETPAPEQPALNIKESIALAVQHQDAGDFSKAENIYQQILQVEPKQPVALQLLGNHGSR